MDQVLARAREMKSSGHARPLAGRSVGLVFFNPSLRTRVSFDVGIHQLGGHAVDLQVGAGVWGMEVGDGAVMDQDKAEHVKEAVRVLARYVDCLAVRSFPGMKSWEDDRRDPVLAAFARHSPIPVINMESCLWHPCQALADILTAQEILGNPREKRFVLAWAWHPKALPTAVPNSALTIAAQFGMDCVVARPAGWDLDPTVMERAADLARQNGGALTVTNDLGQAARGAHVVYAKSWGALTGGHYGQPAPGDLRPWTVDERLMARTDGAWFMHCLPVRRNVEVADAVIDGPRSAVVMQAENRLHVQKALLEALVTRP